MTLALVLGGTRSGKSREAERLVTALAGGAPVTYVATARPDGDPALDARIATHRLRRPPTWRTIEAGDDLPGRLRTLQGPVLLDAVGPWVAGLWPDDPDVDGLVRALIERDGDTVVVSEEIGLAIHPETEAGRRFVDLLGTINQAISAVADDVRLVIAGRVLPLPPPEGD